MRRYSDAERKKAKARSMVLVVYAELCAIDKLLATVAQRHDRYKNEPDYVKGLEQLMLKDRVERIAKDFKP